MPVGVFDSVLVIVLVTSVLRACLEWPFCQAVANIEALVCFKASRLGGPPQGAVEAAVLIFWSRTSSI